MGYLLYCYEGGDDMIWIFRLWCMLFVVSVSGWFLCGVMGCVVLELDDKYPILDKLFNYTTASTCVILFVTGMVILIALMVDLSKAFTN